MKIRKTMSDNQENIKCNDLLDMKTKVKQMNQASMKMLLLNPWSISSMQKFGQFKELMHYLDTDFDVMTLPESWLCESLTQIYDIPGYQSLHSCRKDTGKGGVAFYYSQRHHLLSSKIISEVGYNIVQAELEINHESINFVSVYRTPELSLPSIRRFLKELEPILVNNDQRKCIVMGDMNVNLERETTYSQMYVSLLESYYFEICNTVITRESSKTRIDHVCSNFSTEKQHTIVTCPIETGGIIKTDHSLIVSFIKGLENDQTMPNDKMRNKLDHKRIQNQLEYKFHDSILRHFNDCHILAKYIIKTIHETISENQKLIKIRPAKEQCCEWMNEKVQKLIDMKDEIKRKLRRPRSNATRAQLDIISRQLTKAKKKAQRQYEEKLFEKTKDCKQTWASINKVLGRNKKSTKITKLVTPGGTIEDKKQISNEINNYFTLAGYNLAQTIPKKARR